MNDFNCKNFQTALSYKSRDFFALLIYYMNIVSWTSLGSWFSYSKKWRTYKEIAEAYSKINCHENEREN
jgi:SNF family Na+-dependent transporter